MERHSNNFNLIRMLAAFAVLVGHAWVLTGHMAPLPVHGWGVIAFFALSGYLVTASMTRRGPIDYLVSRILRIMPALVVCVTLIVVFLGPLLTSTPEIYFQHRFTRQFWIWNVSLIKDVQFLPGVFFDNPYPGVVNGSLWTIPFEARCYLIVLFCGLIRRLQLVPFAVAAMAATRGDLDQRSLAILSFALGSAFYLSSIRPRWSWMLAFTFLSFIDNVFSVPAIAIAVLLFGKLQGPWTAYNRVGDYSYGFYLWAFPVQQIVASHGPMSPWQNIVVATPITLLLATLSWHIIEKRALAYKLSPAKAGGDAWTSSEEKSIPKP